MKLINEIHYFHNWRFHVNGIKTWSDLNLIHFIYSKAR